MNILIQVDDKKLKNKRRKKEKKKKERKKEKRKSKKEKRKSKYTNASRWKNNYGKPYMK